MSHSSEFCRHEPLKGTATSNTKGRCIFRYDSVRKLLDTPSYVVHEHTNGLLQASYQCILIFTALRTIYFPYLGLWTAALYLRRWSGIIFIVFWVWYFPWIIILPPLSLSPGGQPLLSKECGTKKGDC